MKKTFRLFLILFLAGISQLVLAQVENFTTPGEGTWICPPGVTSVTVECWGGGGAGGGGINGGGVARGGGGAGGGYVKSTIAVSAGQAINFKVGAGATGNIPTNDDETAPSGGNSWFIDAATVNAPGGQGGKSRISSSTTVLSGDGGVYNGTTAVGTLKYNGGNGGTASNSPQMSGSGGSSGGTASDGTNGGAVNTQSIVIGGGFGAAGRNNAFNGNNAGNPGGGGGGARANAITATILTNQQSGGNGGNGQITLTYSGAIGGSYTWNGSVSTDWQVAGNWTPARTAIIPGDNLTFDKGGLVSITNVPAVQTLGSLKISNNTAVELVAASNSSITISGVDGVDLDISAGSALTLSGTASTIKLSLSTGCTANIAGNVTFTGTDAATGLNHQLMAVDAGSVVFKNGSIFTADVNFTNYPFLAAITGVFIFESGASYIHFSGDVPFGGGDGVNYTSFNSGSIYKFTGTAGGTAPAAVIAKPSLSSRTYGQFIADAPSQDFSRYTPSLPYIFLNDMDIKGIRYAIGGNNDAGIGEIRANINIRQDAGIYLGDPTDLARKALWKFNGTSGIQTVTTYDNGYITQPTGATASIIEIQNDVVFNADIEIAGKLIIASGKTLTIASGKTLNNTGIILNMGTLTGTNSGTGFVVNASSNNNTMGTVTGTLTGSDVSLTAVPNSGYQFVNWTEAPTGAIGTDAVLPSFTVSSSRNIVANFESSTGLNSTQIYAYVTVNNRNLIFNGDISAVEIFNAQGKLVYANKQAVNTVSINSNGIFVVKMHTSAGVKIQKVCVL